jgi:hypothetical protein
MPDHLREEFVEILAQALADFKKFPTIEAVREFEPQSRREVEPTPSPRKAERQFHCKPRPKDYREDRNHRRAALSF